MGFLRDSEGLGDSEATASLQEPPSMGHNVQKPHVGALRGLQAVLWESSPGIVHRPYSFEQRQAVHYFSELPELSEPSSPLQWACS